ncbi:potassium channel family protein [Alkalibacter saccharofermentans]|uniref:Voltage-gated potassium channel n=1 Tax=Alkalibacter saccharofermentans DSM 14828 TaxID=1120975 RepID=A0A1M4VM69_9FIRM|nr:potassium channel protein [Alkalibacter saccharofermentans]SHE69943.1 voltage-gated potassium channel [Alkalibacter saccharofermentans DSM 14828]
MESHRKFLVIIITFSIIIVVAVIGYMQLLNVGFIDALYMTAITISTVGYGEVGEMVAPAKIFTIFIIFSGLGVAGYGFTSLVALFFEGELKDAWRRRKMENKIAELKNHYIICGAGEIGHTVIKQFRENDLPFVVIEKNHRRASELRHEGVLTIVGDATSEDVLESAHIKKSKGVISTLSNDADNVFTVLTARQMNDDVYIVSKAIDRNAHNKLKKAGANNTISPNEIGGRRMAALVIRPSVMSFLDVITQAGDVTLDLEEVKICTNSDFVGKSLMEAKIPEQTGLIVLAIKRKGDTKLKFNPSSNEILQDGDTMVVLGQEDQVVQLRGMACEI